MVLACPPRPAQAGRCAPCAESRVLAGRLRLNSAIIPAASPQSARTAARGRHQAATPAMAAPSAARRKSQRSRWTPALSLGQSERGQKATRLCYWLKIENVSISKRYGAIAYAVHRVWFVLYSQSPPTYSQSRPQIALSAPPRRAMPCRPAECKRQTHHRHRRRVATQTQRVANADQE